ncbi:DUF167 domain-containing protein [Candidatus Dojkabacteria bacterium]|uniref:UPF0235 protein KC717_05270 n=1 Tax=Candidatus Dojkabacteria bacterium TaxID=2099670 RepID=A0A955L8K1_9BACT|nr:DUF167 domain-containing protein [Candidatus Dojkabacteria bacterium]
MKRIKVKVHPNKNESQIRDKISREDIDVEVDLKAKPVDNEANKELISLLAKYYNVPRTAVSIVSGNKGRIKHVEIR